MMGTLEKFVVRQRVITAKGNMIIDVHEGNHYREAEMFYDGCVENYGGDYFEFLKISTKEDCIKYTKHV